MPEDWNWPFQLNQYSFATGDTTTSTRLAWGMNFGAVGDAAYAVFGDDPDNPAPGSPSGYPYQSYATYVVIGRHSGAPVMDHALAVEVATTRTSVTAATGAVRASGPAGVGRTDEVARDPAGYDPILGVWELDAAAGALDATFHVSGDTPLVAPIVVVHGAAAGAGVRLAGAPAVAGVDVVRSHDPATGTLWLTFLSAWRGDVRVEVSP